jgi:lipopolysaccharide/colanic/teichoic acid biosynthesis glycosyltransferase
MLKRCVDVCFSLTGLVILAPLLLATAIAVRLESRGPALYCARRAGRGGKPFYILKFRSMVIDADKSGPSSTASDDKRITKVGAFVRRFKIDELPQLINVLKGEMSLVGPRPQVEWAVAQYTDRERHLLDVRPGITDFASLHYRNEGEILRGSADPDTDYFRLIAPGKTALGLHYVENHNLLTDLRIVAATALVVAGVDPEWCFGPAERAALAEAYPDAISTAAKHAA